MAAPAPSTAPDPNTVPDPFAGLELLATAVVLLDRELMMRYVNPAAEHLFATSRRKLVGMPLHLLLDNPNGLAAALDSALHGNWRYSGHDLTITRADGEPIPLECTIAPVEAAKVALVLELRPIDAQLRVAREELLLHQQQANRELIRNLAHEIKNPLGGIRGSAQLLQAELDSAQLREFTEVIIAEADRLQELMNRLLGSQRIRRPQPTNIHDVLERVCRLILAEFPALDLDRDYDLSLPEFAADSEQLIQAVLNVVRNAAQAVEGKGQIRLRTRILRKATLIKRRYKLALELQIIDNGPGVPREIQDQIFYPLVTGRDGGSGLGLSLTQDIIEQHQGMIGIESRPGHTCVTIHLPISNRD